MFTRKDYKAIADVIKAAKTRAKKRGQNRFDVEDTFRTITHGLADYFQANNPNFNWGKFFDACNA